MLMGADHYMVNEFFHWDETYILILDLVEGIIVIEQMYIITS